MKKGRRGNGVALRWQVAILKILAAQADGEASVSSLARDLSILVAAKERRQQAVPRSLSTALFVDGLIERPGKGRWRISAAGRAYLRALEQTHDATHARLTVQRKIVSTLRAMWINQTPYSEQMTP